MTAALPIGSFIVYRAGADYQGACGEGLDKERWKERERRRF